MITTVELLEKVSRVYTQEWYFQPSMREISEWVNGVLKETSGTLETFNILRDLWRHDLDKVAVLISVRGIDPKEKRKLEETFYRGE